MRRWTAVALGVSLLMLAMLGGGSAMAAKSTPASSLKALAKQTGKLPATAASKAQRRRLAAVIRHARKVVRKKPCSAVSDLNKYRRTLGRVRVRKGKRYVKPAQRLAALGPASLRVSRQLLASKSTKRCGGGVKPSGLKNTKAQVLKSDENGLSVRVQLPTLTFSPETGGGQTWTKLAMPNTDSPGAPGTPAIPVVSSTFGIPEGATVQMKLGKTESYTLGGVEVLPVQPDPVDADTSPPDFTKGPFAARPFTVSNAAYRRNALVPSAPADADTIGSSRDLAIGALQVPAAQYNARSGALKVFKSVDVNVTFAGGSHTFSDELASPWEYSQRRTAASFLNAGVLLRNVREVYRRCGEEMLVITNPATRAAADAFATGKRAQGMRTSVVETGTGAGQIGTTAAQVQTFIRGRLTRFLCIHPSYVTIMGDDDLVPTFPGINGIPSDLQYSMRNDTDELPDVAVGRIIGNDNAAVDTAVRKILGYENNPPGSILRKAMIAAQFQDDDNNGQENRTFIQFSETVRNGLVGRNVAVDRIYGEHPGNNPQKFNDGTDLPAALKKPTFAWDGDGADVTAGWNDGRFMVVHRDHGWSDGWGTPGFTTSNVQALTNGANLPVVFSINCSSGAFDYDETSFAGESLVKANGGAVGVFGDTRDSPSWHNTQIAFGFVDALLPSILPAEGPATKQRVGQALIHGKLRLAGLAPPATDGSTRNELYLWHYFGDPSMQMWGGDPLRIFDIAEFRAVLARQIPNPPPGPDPPPYWVTLTLPAELNGQAVSLLRNGEVIGKGNAVNGSARIPATFGDGAPKPGELQVAVDGDGAQPITVPVDTPKLDTSISQTCPPDDEYNDITPIPISGKLEGAPAGSKVDVTYETPDRTVVVQGITDAQGNYSVELDGDGNDSGTWKVTSRYAGTADYAPSQVGPCSFEVFGS